jgi:hypothetical protein
VVYELSPSGDGSWSEIVLYQFCSVAQCSDGQFPGGNLIEDSAGGLFGVTNSGGLPCNRGPYGCGTVFKLTPNGANFDESVLYTFCAKNDCKDGAAPVGGLVLDQFSNLFGATFEGGGNDIDQEGIGGGVIFELSGADYNVLHRFCSKSNCADGEYPEAGLVIDGAGALYGTTFRGGAFGGIGGTLFDFAP